MEIGALKRDIKANNLKHFYIFTGAEVAVQDVYIKQIAKVTKTEIQRIDEVKDVYKSQKSLFAKPKCFICRDDNDFIKTEKAWKSINDVLKNNILILLVTAVDKRSKFYKHYKDDIIQFDYLNVDTLKKYILKELDLSDYWCNALIEVCESDYSRILLEISKIKSYMKANNIDVKTKADKAVSELISDGTIHIPPQDAIFDYVDAVLMNKPKLAFELLEDCKKINEPALRLISVLYTNAKKVLQVQSCTSSDVAKSTGLSAWDIKCVKNKLDKWSVRDLVYMLRLFQGAEKSIKTGKIDEYIVMDYIMINLF